MGSSRKERGVAQSQGDVGLVKLMARGAAEAVWRGRWSCGEGQGGGAGPVTVRGRLGAGLKAVLSDIPPGTRRPHLLSPGSQGQNGWGGVKEKVRRWFGTVVLKPRVHESHLESLFTQIPGPHPGILTPEVRGGVSSSIPDKLRGCGRSRGSRPSLLSEASGPASPADPSPSDGRC